MFFFLIFRLGGDEGSMMLSWTSLNPSILVQQMNSFDKYFNFKSFEKFMKQVSVEYGVCAVWRNRVSLKFLIFHVSSNCQQILETSRDVRGKMVENPPFKYFEIWLVQFLTLPQKTTHVRWQQGLVSQNFLRTYRGKFECLSLTLNSNLLYYLAGKAEAYQSGAF